MQITINTNVIKNIADLRKLIENADDNDTFTVTKAQPTKLNDCWCGCGGQTKSSFVPGHDSKLHSLAKRIARQQVEITLEDALAALPHDEARADFQHHHDTEKPLHEAREAEKARKRKEREEAADAA